MITVVIVDDHPVVRSGLQALLAGEPTLTVVGSAASGEEALTLVAALNPDVVLCDLRLGDGMDGVAVTEILRRAGDRPAVLILTTYDNDGDIVRAVMAGAAGYLRKDADPDQIAAGIRDAAAGRLVLSPEQERRVAERMTDGVPQLSDREHEVLTLVADGLANKEIARTLFISEATVKTHLVHIFGKLRVESRTSAVATARAHRLINE